MANDIFCKRCGIPLNRGEDCVACDLGNLAASYGLADEPYRDADAPDNPYRGEMGIFTDYMGCDSGIDCEPRDPPCPVTTTKRQAAMSSFESELDALIARWRAEGMTNPEIIQALRKKAGDLESDQETVW